MDKIDTRVKMLQLLGDEVPQTTTRQRSTFSVNLSFLKIETVFLVFTVSSINCDHC